MKLLKLSNGGSAIVDDVVFPELRKHNWHKEYRSGGSFNVRRNTKEKGKTIILSRVVMGVVNRRGVFVTYRNKNGLDNQKANLMLATRRQIHQHRKKHWNSRSKYMGVSFYKKTVKGKDYNYWKALIRIDGKQTSLANFPFTKEGEIEAAKAYDRAAKKHHKKFANLNFK